MQNEIRSMIQDNINTDRLIYDKLAPKIEEATKLILDILNKNKKIFIAGNGGSCSQASHIAAEFVGRYKIERKGLPCIALNADASILTALSNDYSFDDVFARQLEALANPGDIFIALSTSGNSNNLIMAVEKAKQLNVNTIQLLGKDGGRLKNMADIEIIVPSNNTPRIQEIHLMILHIICELIDKELFGN